ncbi:class I glutamine amidotransferase-like protein [Gonapodya prolifera JEL478]|uniref:Class I glutamine amidotransferase-like protein n=1 Tax=Gonapodya prolifera (strain JEL478) TaxID=1344416 RepID=A0A139ASW0_GONPJ|nr:class I glutamine amidotransferase-like protein [Gonapodya prolifera JEL478]|eukprot:KXS19643.1 class I glutamine amidotransferase-like protein [Gonapodya prolifera JEL478]
MASAGREIRIAVLVCDGLSDWHKTRMGDQMLWFPRLLNAASDRHFSHLNLKLMFDRYDTFSGQLPSSDLVSTYAACVITGSKANAFDQDPWIQQLKAFVLDNHERTRMIGICFGHQLLAEAFGGKVGRMEGGWESGWADVQSVGDLGTELWGRDHIAMMFSHQDHVEVTPPGFTVLLSNNRAPNHSQVMGDTCLSVQGHPEMIASDVSAIVEYRTVVSPVFDPVWAAQVQAGLSQPVDDVFVGAKLLAFILDGRKGMKDVR